MAKKEKKQDGPDKDGHIKPTKADLKAGKPAPSVRGRGRDMGKIMPYKTNKQAVAVMLNTKKKSKAHKEAKKQLKGKRKK